MKAANDRSEENYDPARKEDILGRTKTRLELWEEHLKDSIVNLEKGAEVLRESLLEIPVASRVGCNGLQLCGYQDFAKDVGRALLAWRLALLGSDG